MGNLFPHYIDSFLKDAISYDVDFTVHHEGTNYQVQGWIKRSQRALQADDAGVYPVINAEISVKNGFPFGLDQIKGFHSLKGRIYGEIQADLPCRSTQQFS